MNHGMRAGFSDGRVVVTCYFAVAGNRTWTSVSLAHVVTVWYSVAVSYPAELVVWMVSFGS